MNIVTYSIHLASKSIFNMESARQPPIYACAARSNVGARRLVMNQEAQFRPNLNQDLEVNSL